MIITEAQRGAISQKPPCPTHTMRSSGRWRIISMKTYYYHYYY